MSRRRSNGGAARGAVTSLPAAVTPVPKVTTPAALQTPPQIFWEIMATTTAVDGGGAVSAGAAPVAVRPIRVQTPGLTPLAGGRAADSTQAGHRIDFNILEYLVIQNAQFFLVGWYCVLSIRKVSGWQAHPREATVPW
jgi:hypothetical protein